MIKSDRFRTAVASTLTKLVATLLLVAGLLKLLDLDEFASSLVAFVLLPEWARHVSTFALPTLEVAAGSLLLWRWRSRPLVAFTVALLSAMAGVLAAHLLLRGEIPPCRCFGALSAHAQWMSDARFALAKPLVLMGLLLIVAWLAARSSIEAGLQPGQSDPRAPTQLGASARAFTLIELLVVLAIIGVLLAVSLPALFRARMAAREARALTSQQVIARGFIVYTINWKDAFPQPLAPIAPAPPLLSHYFFAYTSWTAMVGAEVLGDARAVPSDERFPGSGSPGQFLYPCAFLARPEFWDPSTRLDSGQLKATRTADVTHPQLKALNVTEAQDRQPEALRARDNHNIPALLAFVDGSAAPFNVRDVLPGISTGEGAIPEAAHTFDIYRALHTLRGVSGRDVLSR